MPTLEPRIPSIDALVEVAGVDVAAGLQVVPADGRGDVDAARAVIVVMPDGDPDLDHVLAKYPPDTVLTVIRESSDGRLEAGEAVSVESLSEAKPWRAPATVAVALPGIAAEEVRVDLRGLVGVIRRLRDPEDGCPWDLAQDHQSLRPHLLEETYEVLDALDGLSDERQESFAALREELGDLLMQIILHARVAEQAGEFTLGEVAEGIRAKLVRRHPHVFGEAKADTPQQVERNWDQLKAEESKPGGEQRESALDGVPQILPALARAQKLTGRASRRGFAWESDEDVLAKLSEELSEIAAAGESDRAGEVGDLLFVVCDYLRRHGVEAEDALREACGKFERRFRAIEGALREEGAEMSEVGQAGLLRRWERVKEESE